MKAHQELHLAPLILSTLMGNDPHLLLVKAIAWLVPDSLTEREADPRYIDFDYDAEDDLSVGLHICRECFPAVYAGAIQLQWQGADERAVKHYLLEGISIQLVVSVQDWEELRYGPPVDFCGVDLYMLEPEDAENSPYDHLLPVFALFGLSRDSADLSAVESAAFIAAKAMIQSLRDRAEIIYHDLANLLAWMFSCSGNTAVDYTAEVFWENGYDMPGWTPDDIALINNINREAHDHLTSALNALQLLEADPDMHHVFSRNVKTILKAVHKPKQQKGKSHARTRYTNGDPDPADLVRYARWPDRP